MYYFNLSINYLILIFPFAGSYLILQEATDDDAAVAEKEMMMHACNL